MSALAKHEPGQVAPAQTPPDPFMAMIQQASDKPELIPQIRELVAIRNEEIARLARVAYAAALAEMQPELPAAAHRGLNTNTNKSYAKWEDIHVLISPVLARFGFSLSFKTEVTGDKVVVTAILSHREGHNDQTSLPLPIDAGAGRNAVQAVGSTVSYGKRYTACALLNIRTSEDDDGHGAGGVINESQAKVFTDLVETHKANLTKLLKYVKAESVETMTQAQLDTATEALNRWIDGEKTKAEKKAAAK